MQMLGQELVRLAEGLLDSELELVNAAVQLGLPPAFSEVLAIEENSCNIHISVAVRRAGPDGIPDPVPIPEIIVNPDPVPLTAGSRPGLGSYHAPSTEL